MKFTSAIVLGVLATCAFGASSYAGKYAGQPVQQAPTTAPVAAVDDKCWMETKKCCWVEKEDGYECRDNYDTKMARCYMKYKFDKKCDKTEKEGNTEKPDGRVDYERCHKVHYDPNYGPHVAGYPSGMSETYNSNELPITPYKVEAAPHPPYTTPSSASNGYRAPGSGRGY